MNESHGSPEDGGRLIALALVAAALMTRIFDLGVGDVSGDEIFMVRSAQTIKWSLFNPAQYFLVALSFKAFGQSNWVLRLPSVILGILAVPVFFLTWKRIVGKYAALFGAVFVLLSSWHLWHSQYSRFYAGVFLFGSLSFYFYYQALRQESGRHLAFALASNFLAVLFHATAAALAVPCFLFSVVVLTARWQGLETYSRRTARQHVVALCVLGLLAAWPFWSLAVGWYDLYQSSPAGDPNAGAWGYQSAALVAQIVKYLQIPLAAAAVMGWVVVLRRDRWQALFFSLGLAVPVIVATAGSFMVNIRPDYIFYCAPLAFVLAGVAGAEVKRLAGRELVGYALVAVVAAALVPEFASHYTARRSLHFGDAVEFVEQRYQPGDRILSFVPGFLHFSQYPERYPEIRDERSPLAPFPGNEYDSAVDWTAVLDPYKRQPGTLRVIVRTRRSPLAPELESWLFENTSLVWSRHARRFDYGVEGYAVFEMKARPNEAPRL